MELFSIGKEMSFVSRLGVAMGLSMSLNAAVVASYMISFYYAGMFVLVPPLFPELTLVISLVVLLIALASRKALPRPKPTKYDLAVLLMMAFLALLSYFYFLKYPIFPEFQSGDFATHVQTVSGFLSTGIEFFAPIHVLLYAGVHFHLLYADLLVGGEPLIVVRPAMAIFVVLSPALFYAAGETLFNSRRVGVLAAFVYVVGGFIWFAGVYDSGLYPNFYGILSGLTTLILLTSIVAFPRRGTWVAYALAVVNLYLSHFSSLAVLVPAVLLLPVLYARDRAKLRRAAVAAAVLAGPAVLGFLMLPGEVTNVIALATSGESGVAWSTPLSNLISIWPVASYTVAVIDSDLNAVIIVGLALIGVAYAMRTQISGTLPVFWLFALVIAAPETGIAWRFSYVLLVPLTLLASLGLDRIIPHLDRWKIFPRGNRRSRRRNPSKRRVSVTAATAVLVIFGLLLASSPWTKNVLTDVSSGVATYSAAQSDLYNSMVWFGQNTPPGTTLLSVTDWRITFLHDLTGREGILYMYANASEASTYARANGYGYILVTYLIPAVVPQGFDAVAFYNSFTSASNLKQVYNNTSDVIYQVLS